MNYAIETQGLVKRFGEVTALNGLDLRAREGTVFGVLGPNGAGKTTAVRVLASLLRPDEGTAWVGGYDVAKQPHLVRRIIGLTGQYASVDQELTGVQNIVMVARLLGLSRRRAKRLSGELLERFNLAEAGDRKASTYSGGMRRRLDLAVSLVGAPRVLYLDEPTTGLDPESRMEMWDIVRDLVDRGSTVLLTTQYLEEVDRLADDIVVIDGGRCIASGTAEELKSNFEGQSMEVRPTDETRLAETASILQHVTGVAPKVDGKLLTVRVNDSSLPGMILRWLDHSGIAVSELALRQPSLDEVFLSLTGNREEQKDDAADEQPESEMSGAVRTDGNG